MTFRERATELIANWRDKEANVWDTITVKECADDLAAALAAEGQGDVAKCGEPAGHLIAGASWFVCVLPKGHSGEHQRGGNCVKHGEYVGNQCPHWPDCIAAAAPSLHKEGLPANAELLLCIRSLLPIAHLSCQDDDLKPSLEECTDGACAHAKDLLGRAALHKEGLPQATEFLIRMFLWEGHGHNDALYGDDGEMQCGVCHCDFKRNDLHECVEKARVAALEVGLKKMSLHKEGAGGEPLTGKQLEEIALKHRTIVAGFEFAERFDFDAIAAELNAAAAPEPK